MKKILLIAICILTAGACQYKELCYDHAHVVTVSLQYDWTEAPEASPASMTAIFFPEQGGEAVRYDFSGMQGGAARLASGRWVAASYNNDTETILIRGTESAATLEAYTRSSSLREGARMMSLTKGDMPRAKGAESEPVILEPDLLWGGVGAAFELQTGVPQTVSLTPRPLVQNVSIVIHDVPNLQYVNDIGGAVSGLNGSVFLADGRPGEGTATQAFEVRKADATTLSMQFLTFGYRQPEEADQPQEEMDTVPQILTIYAVMTDGTQWYYSEDISEQLQEGAQAPDQPGEPAQIVIDLPGMPIPVPAPTGSGFQPTVDGWQSIEIAVGM